MPGKPWILSETTWKTIKATEYQVAVLPWGAAEAHNYHLPYGTDNYESAHIADESARRAWEAGARVAVLPTIPFGVNTGQLDIRLCINMNPSTQALVLGDVVRSLQVQRIRKLVVLNGHGGNDFRQMIRELHPWSDVFVSTVNWWSCVDPKPFFDAAGDHGGELETSLMMEIHPDLVLPLKDAGEGKAKSFRMAGIRDGVAWAQREWTKITEDTGVGDPSRATREKGARFRDAVCEKISKYLVELAEADLDDLYE
ncbi:MAG TPA: creatininase family protein [Gemmatimonadaceae bacterium]